MHWLKVPVVDLEEWDERERFLNFVLPLLVHYRDSDGAEHLARLHPWLTSWNDPSRRHEAARLFHENPTQSIAVLQRLVSLKFCQIFGSTLMQYSAICGVARQLYNIVIEKIASTSCSVELSTKAEEENRAGFTVPTLRLNCGEPYKKNAHYVWRRLEEFHLQVR